MAYPIESLPTPPAGDFLSQKKYNPVARTELAYDDETEHATIREKRVWMRDGSLYKLSEIRPKHQAVDVPMVRTPSWTIRHNGGVEGFVAEKMAAIGVPTFSISPQQNLFRIGNMRRSSHDYVEIARYTSDMNGLDPEHIIPAGASRGADYAIGMTAVAPAHGVEASYAEIISPCLPLNIIRAKLVEGFWNLMGEPQTLYKIIMEDLEYAKVLLETPALDPWEAFQQAKEIATLADGSPGALAHKMPEDTFATIQHFKRDGLGDTTQWWMLDGFKKVIQRFDDGTHMHCVAPRTIAEKIARLTDVRDGIRSGIVGAAALHAAVAVGNPAFEVADDRHLSIVPAS